LDNRDSQSPECLRDALRLAGQRRPHLVHRHRAVFAEPVLLAEFERRAGEHERGQYVQHADQPVFVAGESVNHRLLKGVCLAHLHRDQGESGQYARDEHPHAPGRKEKGMIVRLHPVPRNFR